MAGRGCYLRIIRLSRIHFKATGTIGCHRVQKEHYNRSLNPGFVELAFRGLIIQPVLSKGSSKHRVHDHSYVRLSDISIAA